MPAPVSKILRTALFAGLLAASANSAASGLQVSPVSVTLTGGRPAEELWVSNVATQPLHVQVRVYHWSQEGGSDAREPSRGLVVSPPMLELAPGQKQLVRVIRTGAPPKGPGAPEDAFRIAIDELPVINPHDKGLRFVLHYSVPVFIEPVGAPLPTARIDFAIHRDGDHAILEVTNHGNGHAQIAALSFVDSSGRRTEITAGLLGYALAGQTMRFTLIPKPAIFANGGKLDGQLNGRQVSLPVAPTDGSR